MAATVRVIFEYYNDTYKYTRGVSAFGSVQKPKMIYSNTNRTLVHAEFIRTSEEEEEKKKGKNTAHDDDQYYLFSRFDAKLVRNDFFDRFSYDNNSRPSLLTLPNNRENPRK